MTQSLPFDAKNARDFIEITRKITDALSKIEKDRHLPATKANLARLAGVHRNTLYNRAVSSSPDNDVNKGWPFQKLKEIANGRNKQALSEPQGGQSPTLDEVAILQEKLKKSRYVAGAWFHRSLELKRERDEARRQVELLVDQVGRYKRDIDVLQTQVRRSIRVVSQ